MGKPESAASPVAMASSWSRTFSALRHRNYRLFWGGQLVSLTGTWMQNAAQSWLVLLLATSEFGKVNAAFYVGLVSALGSMPIFLLCLFAGVISDTHDRRRILLLTQCGLMVLAFALGVLVQTGTVRLWHVAIFSMCSGLIMAFDMPTRQAFIKDIASPRDLLNAIALNSTIFNLARIFGPAVAGQLIKVQQIDLHLAAWHLQVRTFGIPGALYINAASFLAVLLGLLLIRVAPAPRHPREGNVWQHMAEGFRYVAGERTTFALLVMMAIFSVFGFSYAVLLSVVAVQVLGLDSSGYGWLMTASGVGATVGALLLAGTAGRIRKGQVLLWGGTLSTLALIGFSFSRSFPLSMLLLTFVGGGLVVCSASINSLIQEIVPDHLRGRVVSIWAFIFAGFTPIGSLFAGVMAHLTTPCIAIMISGIICLALIAFFSLRMRWIWLLQ